MQNGTAGVTLEAESAYPSNAAWVGYNLLRENRREGSDTHPGGQLVVGNQGVQNATITNNIIDGYNVIVRKGAYIPSPFDPAYTCRYPKIEDQSIEDQYNDGIESWGSGHKFVNNSVVDHTGHGISLANANNIDISNGGISTTTQREHYGIAITSAQGITSSTIRIGCTAGWPGCQGELSGPLITGPHDNAVYLDAAAGYPISNVGVFHTIMSGFTSNLAACNVGLLQNSAYIQNSPSNPQNGQQILACQSVCPSTLSIISNFPSSGGSKSATLTTSAGCQWSATGNAWWVSNTPTSGSGSTNISIVTQSIGSATIPRSGSATVSGGLVRFTQAPPTLDSQYMFGDINYNDATYAIQGDTGAGNYLALLKYYYVTNGCDVNKFCPDDSLTKGQIAAFLVRAILYRPSDTSSCKSAYPRDATNPYPCGFTYSPTPSYTDVSSPNIFFPYIQKLKELGLSLDCGYLSYCPDNIVTRAQMAEMVIRSMVFKGKFEETFPYPQTPYFADVPSNAPYFRYVQKQREQAITAGASATTYGPLDSLKRFQMAIFLVRAFFTIP